MVGVVKEKWFEGVGVIFDQGKEEGEVAVKKMFLFTRCN